MGLLSLAQQGRLKLASVVASGIPGLNSGKLPTVNHAASGLHSDSLGANQWDEQSQQAGEDHEEARPEGDRTDETEAGPSSGAGSCEWAEAGVQDRLSHLRKCIVGGESSLQGSHMQVPENLGHEAGLVVAELALAKS